MIQFVKHQDLDRNKWDHVVTTSPYPSVFATSELLDILTDNSEWNALVDDDYSAVMPLPCRKKWGVCYVYTPFFASQLGIFSIKPVTAEKVLDFFRAIPPKYRQVDLFLNAHNPSNLIVDSVFTYVSHQIDLKVSYDNLYKSFSQNTKRNIKASEKHFLTIEKNEKLVCEIIELFRNNRGKSEAVHYRDRDYEVLVRASEALLSHNCLDVWGVRNQSGKLIAGALIVLDGKKRLFWFSGRDECATDNKPMFFLLNEYLKQNAEQDLIFDFNGSLNENVARMYKGLGGTPYPIPMIKLTKGLLLKCVHRLRH